MKKMSLIMISLLALAVLGVPSCAEPNLEQRLEREIAQFATNSYWVEYVESIKQLHAEVKNCDYPADTTDTKNIECIFNAFHKVSSTYDELSKHHAGVSMWDAAYVIVENTFRTRTLGKDVQIVPFMEVYLPSLKDEILQVNMTLWKQKLLKDLKKRR